MEVKDLYVKMGEVNMPNFDNNQEQTNDSFKKPILDKKTNLSNENISSTKRIMLSLKTDENKKGPLKRKRAALGLQHISKNGFDFNPYENSILKKKSQELEKSMSESKKVPTDNISKKNVVNVNQSCEPIVSSKSQSEGKENINEEHYSQFEKLTIEIPPVIIDNQFLREYRNIIDNLKEEPEGEPPQKKRKTCGEEICESFKNMNYFS